MKHTHVSVSLPKAGKRSTSTGKSASELIFVIGGALLASISIELFLVPNRLLVGGTTGLSMLLSYWTELRLGLLLLAIHAPFLFLGFRKLQHSRQLIGLYGVLTFVLTAILLHPVPGLTEERLPAAVLGGAALGLGIGMAVRFGGFLDLADRFTAMWKDKLPISVRQLVIIGNGVLLIAFGTYYGGEQAMYSVVAYISALLTVQYSPLQRMFMKKLRITSSHAVEISLAIKQSIGVEVKHMAGRFEQDSAAPADENTAEPAAVIELTCNRLEVAKLKDLIRTIDPDATIRSAEDE